MESELVDVYCDSAQILLGPFDLLLYLSQRPSIPGSTMPPKMVGCVRMSLEHAKVLTIMLRKVLKQHEEIQGSPINIIPQVYQQLGLSPQEDW
ncbi:MAG: hypothetical protein ABSA16_10005 [Thermoguttaceae bacterium]|jgi:hypothetical protein